MPLHANLETAPTKRELRGRIARSRRRIDRHLHALGRDARRLTSWRTYVERFPGPTIASAFTAGFLASSGRLRRICGRWMIARLVEAAWKGIKSQLWDEVSGVWDESRPTGSFSGGDAQARARKGSNENA